MLKREVQIKPWVESNLDLLHQLNIPEMLEHLGGVETEEQVVSRNKRYSAISVKGTGRMFSIELMPESVQVGNVGYWESEFDTEPIYEMGWGVLPEYQGQGIAYEATLAAIASARAEGNHIYLHAFPSTNNPGSNALCRKLNFKFIAESDFEYPKGNWMKCNNWRLNLRSAT
ncbi:GNAT family N-acetyltransferase [Paenibacillus sp. N1-5-1-14]|uniref:GNAT family N-acetyltransferase n=1 Tax=Paenibacillus radicibacter TaxID=2972488 RepID=UPI0021594277|nr:GNAT family N-acetyltransferase [Paenibacillus radicibacter]MCR8644334.1 GNAT family N-acetyltransferase [Paenibacillus radicibacter]